LPPAFAWQTEPESVSQILHELLTNAGKYAHPQTAVELQATLERDLLIFKIINQGKAIPPEEQDYIFEKFRRGTGVTQQAIGGTGLGLALVKSLVQHLQGEISVTSEGQEPLATVCFAVALPLQTKEDG
jgi:signal transduction histidine kinase